MLLLYSQFLKKSLQFAIFFIARCLDFETFCILFVWSLIHSIGIFFFAGRKCVDLVVIFNKGREETFAVFLQKRKSCVCIRYLTLVRPRKLIPVNFAQNSFIAKKLFISQFFKQIKLCHCLLLFKKHFSPQKMFVMFMCTSWRLLEQYI